MQAPLLGRKILIVDDDPDIRELLVAGVKAEGGEVRFAVHGRNALEILTEWDPQLVLLDQDMPEMGGIETVREIRRRKLDVDVLFVSAHGGANVVSEALEAGADDYVRKPFSFIELVARIKVRFRIRDLHAELLNANSRLDYLSQHDDLTGLFNMRSMYDRIDHELARTRRSHKFVACIMMDMDHFKRVNDNHDHLFGSFVLKEVGRLLQETMRDVDFAARYGGDEFLIVLTDTDQDGVSVFAKRFLEVIRKHEFVDGKDRMKLTASLGYAVSSWESGANAREMVRFADHALYEAKEGGRNRTDGVTPQQVLVRKKKSAA